MGETHQKPHAIVFPYPYQGHITPTINLVTNLASKGFTITYVQLDHIHHTIMSDGADADPFVGARHTLHDHLRWILARVRSGCQPRGVLGEHVS